ncbi:MAG TPA: hypothetical protein VN605_04405, partial [Thermoanaerobaculia bacterium]|nr:hypothetical protein [Thermoanaerobaculia bacterium]
WGSKTAVVDISNPKAPVVKSVVDSGGVTRGVAAAGNVMAVADGGAGVHFVDITNPGAPRITGAQATGGNAWDALFAGGVLYVANEQGLVTIGSVSAPPQIDVSRIGVSIASTTTASIAGQIRAITGQAPLLADVRNATTGVTTPNVAVAADGSFTATIAARSGDALTIAARDGGNRTAGPVSIGQVPFGSAVTNVFIPPSQSDNSFRARTLASEGNLLAVTGWNNDQGESAKAAIYDITNPAAPVYKRTVEAGNGQMYDIDIHDGWGYVASYDFCTINLADPNATRNCIGLGAGEIGVVATGNYAFATRSGGGGWIRVYDVSNPASPRYLREQSFVGSVDFWDIVSAGSDYLLAFAPDGVHDIVTIDRRDVNSLVKVGDLDIPNFTAFRGRVYGTTLYLSGWGSKMAVVDISNPKTPIVLSVTDTGGVTRGVAAAGTVAATADGTAGVRLLDVTHPSAPLVTGLQPVGGNAWDALFTGGVLYVANEQGFAVIADAATPPSIDAAQISVSLEGTSSARVIGRVKAVGGAAPLSLELRDSATNASISGLSVNADGTFNGLLPASSGDPILVKVTDAAGRVAGPLPVGTVPFGGGVTQLNISPAQSDNSFRARTLRSEGNILAVTGWNNDQGESAKAAIYDISDPSAPVYKRTIDAGNGQNYDMDIHNGWAFVASYDFCTINLADPNASRNCIGLGAGEIAVAATGNYAFATRSGGGGWIRVYDVSSPGSPRYLREQSFVGSVDFWGLVSAGTDYLIASAPDGPHDLVVIDRRDVNSLVKVAEIDIPNFTAFRGRIVGTTLYLSGWGGKVAIVDIANPRTPVVLSVTD